MFKNIEVRDTKCIYRRAGDKFDCCVRVKEGYVLGHKGRKYEMRSSVILNANK